MCQSERASIGIGRSSYCPTATLCYPNGILKSDGMNKPTDNTDRLSPEPPNQCKGGNEFHASHNSGCYTAIEAYARRYDPRTNKSLSEFPNMASAAEPMGGGKGLGAASSCENFKNYEHRFILRAHRQRSGARRFDDKLVVRHDRKFINYSSYQYTCRLPYSRAIAQLSKENVNAQRLSCRYPIYE